MYGMVNKAAQEFIESQFGNETWQQVKQKADLGILGSEFELLKQYPDQITYSIVDAASEILDLPTAAVLETFGEFWIGFARRSGYESLMDSAGTNIFEFLEGLDDMHTRLSLSFKDYRPPSFYCTDGSESSTRLHYVSERDGLAAFVVGLVRGLGKMFETPVTVTQEKAKSEGADHDVFLVEVTNP